MDTVQQVMIGAGMSLAILICAVRWYEWRRNYFRLREMYVGGVKIKQSRFFPVDPEDDYFYFPDEDNERVFHDAWERLQVINKHKRLNVPAPSEKGYQLGDFAKD